MTDDKFEETMVMLVRKGFDSTAEQLHARDKAQREALARVEAELAERTAAHANVLEELRAFHAAKPWLVEQQLAQAVGLLQDGIDRKSGWSEIAERFIARHAQAEQQEECEPVLARPEHGATLDDALALTMDRYSGALDQLAVIEQQEAQGAQAGDEQVAKAIYDADRSLFMTKREYAELHPQTKERLLKMARAALATQPAVPVYLPEANVWDAPSMSADTEPEIAWRDGFNDARDRVMNAVRGAEHE